MFNFNASFYIVKTDGTASHSQDIYDLVLNDQPICNNNSIILIETYTVTMKDWTSKRLPINITMIGDTAISIML